MARKSRNLEERKLVLVYTEGPTEKKYFTRLRSTNQARKNVNLEIKSISGGKQGIPLMNYVKGSLSRIKKADKPDKVFVIFDKDDLSDEEISHCLIDFPEFQVGFSNRSFELWLLLHFQKVTSFKNQQQLEDELSEALTQKYVKADEKQLDQTIQHIEQAFQNAQDFGALNVENAKRNPYTNLAYVIKEMLK